MQVKVYNCPDVHFKPYVIKAAEFFAKELIPNTRIRNNCLTEIRFDGNIVNFGSCGAEGYNTKNEPREFLIEIHPGIGARDILSTLAHEMVHVKQLIYHETNDDLSSWKGKRFNSDLVDYWEHPWEIDAHGRESGLLTKFAVQEVLWEVFHDFKNPNLPIVSSPIKWKT
jgi:hypothetical protein